MTENSKTVRHWQMSEHRTAVKMWSEGATLSDIAEALDRSPRSVDYYVSKNRELFPRRRAKKGRGKEEHRLLVTICVKEFEEMTEVALSRSLPVSALVRNALLMAKRQGWPIESVEAMVPPGLPLHPEPARKRSTGKITYAGKTAREGEEPNLTRREKVALRRRLQIL